MAGPADSEKANIFFVIGSLEVGGAEGQMYLLVKQLQGQAYMCHVYSLQSGGPLEGRFENLGVPVYSGGLKKGDVSNAPWKVILAGLRLLRLVYRLKPSVMHCYLPLITFMGALSGRMACVPLVISSRRALGTHQRRYPILVPLDRLANRLSHRVTVNSRAVWNDMVRRDHIDPAKLVLIYNGVDTWPLETAFSHREETRRELGIGANEKVIIVVANLIPYKGHSDLIQAATLVTKRFPKAVFLVVGEDRGILIDLEQQVSEFGIGQSFKFLGRRNDISNLLGASDISVLPSHEEGFSNVILESMAAGLPVVAADVGGNGEAVRDGVTGWLVPPREPSALSAKILDLLSNTAKAREWGEKGRQRVKRMFTVEKMSRAHMKLYGSRDLR